MCTLVPFAVFRVFLTPMTSVPVQPASIPTYLAMACAVSDYMIGESFMTQSTYTNMQISSPAKLIFW